ncbi:soluble lytic murein transglycosylase precursor [Clostridium tepidiprofundi DSM 19306]|uniref:Soluble lytic murein transglycosylase n=1 Tax=Clostridium tepidiprofundi DSM 19306 TaxID=1121338 RepID=A0A151B291_9CLOT|nr:soluble lytic murein transglycosylase precursor [Clostridium tepidiprofundi DSM 19306]
MIILIAVNIKNILRVFYPTEYSSYVIMYAEKYDIDPLLVYAVIKAESNFNPNATSCKNAIGLMQITPSTAKWIAKRMGIHGFNTDKLYDPELNICMGCWYLNDLNKEFNNNIDLVLAAYNGGRGNVNKWLKIKKYSKNGKELTNIPFKETDEYVKKVKVNYNIYKNIYK